MYKGLTICAIIPAFNEAPAIGKVVTELLAITDDNAASVIDEIIVCDNASVDNTAEVARTAGARVVHQPIPGYGIACLTALQARASTDVVLFVDGDDSCFPLQALRLLDGIAAGDDVAIGSRALGDRERGALTPVQEFGNRLSAFLIRQLWNAQVTDLGPFRAVRSSALAMVNMEDKAFGWTVELQVKALQLGLQMNEYAVDSKVRIGESKISGTLK
ncbi:MAG: glycosyltransferase family 2 protein, partial [Halioglobus sp.]